MTEARKQQQAAAAPPTKAMARPKGSTGRSQLTTEQRQRVRTLFFDARMSKTEIVRVTGYSANQIRYAIRAEGAIVKTRSGRPKGGTKEAAAKKAAAKEAAHQEAAAKEATQKQTAVDGAATTATTTTALSIQAPTVQGTASADTPIAGANASATAYSTSPE